MQVINLSQGSPEWLAHRAKFFNASDAPSMMGVSPYKSRTELLQERSTGLVAEVSAFTQQRFFEGHKFEALARPFAEKILGEELYPVTGVEDRFSASFDGLTMSGSISFEHKTLNAEIRACFEIDSEVVVLPMVYQVQIEHQFMVSGAEKCLFMASVFDADGYLIEEKHCWVFPNLELRKDIVNGWDQFSKDLAVYVHTEIAERPRAEVMVDLPALFVHAKGEITTSNMEEYGLALAQRLADVRAIQLITDQDFSNAKQAASMFREQCKKLKQAKEAMLAQTLTIGEAARMIDAWEKDLRETALQLEKDVEREDGAKKLTMVNAAKAELAAHMLAIDEEINPIRLLLPVPDFAGSLKGKRNYSSMQDGLNTCLADAKIKADAAARDIRNKLSWHREYAKDHTFLFADLQTIIFKTEDDFQLLCKSRIDTHKQAEDKRLQEEREKIRIEEEAKAEAKVKAEAEAQAKDEADLKAKNPPSEVPDNPAFVGIDVGRTDEAVSVSRPSDSAGEPTKPSISRTVTSAQTRPTDDQIIDTIALHYRVHESKVLAWLIDMDLKAAGKRMGNEVQHQRAFH